MAVRLTIRNIGPIKSAEAEFNRLTVLVGPNNSGKSVLAALAYAALSSSPVNGGLHRRVPPAWGRYFPEFVAQETLFRYEDEPEVLSELQMHERRFLAGEPLRSEELSPRLWNTIARLVGDGLHRYAESLMGEIERCFAGRLEDLVRMRSGRRMPARIVVSHTDPDWRVELRSRREGFHAQVEHSIDPLQILGASRDSGLGFPPGIEPSRSLWFILARVFRSFPPAVYYLPAARSGILQSRRALASFVVRRVPLAGIEELDIPLITGVVSDFIGDLLTLEPERSRSPYEEIANRLEGAVLGGSIAIRSGPSGYPEIFYRSPDVQLPLHRTSSMVSELAPVILYLRYLLDAGQMLIIEEPESHLHPESQVRLARTVVSLVNSGLNIALTTHSDYFLQQLNNSIMAANVGGAGDLPALPAELASAYLFKPMPGDGTLTVPIEVDPQEGISDKEFSRVAESLYDSPRILRSTTFSRCSPVASSRRSRARSSTRCA